MATFGHDSLSKISSLHPLWEPILHDVIKWFDFKVTCGHRTMEDQTKAYLAGLSKKRWPESKHNPMPSIAVDVAPYHATPPHIRWNATKEFYFLAGAILEAAESFDTEVRWGGDWDRDGDLYDQTFMDLGHFELVSVDNHG